MSGPREDNVTACVHKAYGGHTHPPILRPYESQHNPGGEYADMCAILSAVVDKYRCATYYGGYDSRGTDVWTLYSVPSGFPVGLNAIARVVERMRRQLTAVLIERFREFIHENHPRIVIFDPDLNATNVTTHVNILDIELRDGDIGLQFATLRGTRLHLVVTAQDFLGRHEYTSLWEGLEAFNHEKARHTLLLGMHKRIGGDSSVHRVTQHTLYERECMRLILDMSRYTKPDSK